MVPGRTVAHRREKVTDFSDEIMRKDKKIESNGAGAPAREPSDFHA
jgi:hypothetical protein